MRNFLLVLVYFLVISGFAFPFSTTALVNKNFGGRIITSIPCTCSFGYWITVGAPRPGSFIYAPGSSRLYRNYNIFSSGPWALGIGGGRGTCLQYAGATCVEIGSGPIIRGVGTSVR